MNFANFKLEFISSEIISINFEHKHLHEPKKPNPTRNAAQWRCVQHALIFFNKISLCDSRNWNTITSHVVSSNMCMQTSWLQLRNIIPLDYACTVPHTTISISITVKWRDGIIFVA
jgi:hypothetical protein